MGKKRKEREEEFNALQKKFRLLQERYVALQDEQDSVNESDSDKIHKADSISSGSEGEGEGSETEDTPRQDMDVTKDVTVHKEMDFDGSEDKENKDGNEVENKTEDTPLDENIAEILGQNPLNSNALNLKLHKEIHDRWKFWFLNGIQKSDREELIEKYASPSGLEVPKLNAEISAKLPKPSKSRDYYMSKRQQLAGSALAAIGASITTLINEKESIDKLQLIERLNDAGKLITEIMHSQTKSRRAFVVAGIDKDTKVCLENTKIGKFLFGDNLAEKIKEARTINRVADSLQNQKYSSVKNQTPRQSLNYNSLHGKRPFQNQAGASYGNPTQSARPRLFFKNNQNTPRSQNQSGFNRAKNQNRFK